MKLTYFEKASISVRTVRGTGLFIICRAATCVAPGVLTLKAFRLRRH